ncbi:MAG: histidine--tRNA ligase [Candidatus Aenigmarchaeota archaeon]|nr:histidine--tRNA ligase [Candidatus Aenigmarchaeota archaeon]
MPKFQTPRGTRDFLPEKMTRRQSVLDTLRSVFEKWGYEPLETPAFEDWALLSAKQGGGEEIKKEIFYFKDKGGRELGLRFDLTIPLARVIANNPQLPKPFKRYAIGRVWRYDEPQAGRYREFWQADVDIVGSPESEADAEIMAVACEALLVLGFEQFEVRVSDRRILDSFVKSLGVKEPVKVFRAIDKLEKAGEEQVRSELRKAGLGAGQVTEIMRFIAVKSMEQLRSLVSSDEMREALAELDSVLAAMKGYGYSTYVRADMSLVRGLEYYTGPVFEIKVGAGRLSIGGGGRYDGLIQLLGGKATPATGISFGVERLVDIMEAEKMLELPKTKTSVFVAGAGDVRPAVLKAAKELRRAGISCEYDVMQRDLGKQLQYVNAKGVPYALIIGEKEAKEGIYRLRNMKTGEEKLLKTVEEIAQMI